MQVQLLLGAYPIEYIGSYGARGAPPLFGIILAVGKLLKLVILELVRIQWMIYLLP